MTLALLATDAPIRLGWLHRRFGWGDRTDNLPASAEPAPTTTDDAVAALFSSDGDVSDPWGARTPTNENDERGRVVREWFAHTVSSNAPLHDRRTFELHGWLVSSIGAVPTPLMVEQLRLFADMGAGSFPDLLRAVTVDPAMLVYLDGRTSQASGPNENYARELLELFSLGTGLGGAPTPYEEADVAAAAAALTGWTVRRGDGKAQFVPRRHDDTLRPFLGSSGVSDVDGVIDAIAAHPEHDRFVAAQIARIYVGVPTTPSGDDLEPDPDTIDELAAAYRDGGRRLDRVIEVAAHIVADAADQSRVHPIVAAPVPWMVGAARQLDVSLSSGGIDRDQIRAMGQIPMVPPSVAGWPGGRRWLTTSGLVARTNVAAGLVAVTPDHHPALGAAADGDVDTLAAILGLAGSFGPTTVGAIRSADGPAAALTLALVAPEYLLT